MSLLITTEGLPLGFTSKRFWSRDKFKNAKALYTKKNATRIPTEKKESYRWIENLKDSNTLLKEPERVIHVGDRESDIYEFFRAAEDDGSHFLVRIKVNRRTEDETVTLHDVMKSAEKRGQHTIVYHDRNGAAIEATLEIKFEKLTIKPSFGPKTKLYPDTEVTVIHAREVGTPKGDREAIDWRLMTNLPVGSLADAVEKLGWYALRWKIEVFFKILKSGCNIEESKLQSADGLFKLMAICSVLSWRIFWMTMVNRETEGVPPEVALTSDEIKILDHLKPDSRKRKKNLADYLMKIAKLGGYLARASDPPPGNKVIWRGLKKLAMIQIGFEMGKLVGN